MDSATPSLFLPSSSFSFMGFSACLFIYEVYSFLRIALHGLYFHIPFLRKLASHVLWKNGVREKSGTSFLFFFVKHIFIDFRKEERELER